MACAVATKYRGPLAASEEAMGSTSPTWAHSSVMYLCNNKAVPICFFNKGASSPVRDKSDREM